MWNNDCGQFWVIYVEVSGEGVEAAGGHPAANGVKVVGESAEADGGIVSALQKK